MLRVITPSSDLRWWAYLTMLRNTRELATPQPQVVEDFGLVRFLPLAIEDRASVARVLEDVDKANGCAFSGLASPAAPMPPELIYGAGVKGERSEAPFGHMSWC